MRLRLLIVFAFALAATAPAAHAAYPGGNGRITFQDTGESHRVGEARRL